MLGTQWHGNFLLLGWGAEIGIDGCKLMSLMYLHSRRLLMALPCLPEVQNMSWWVPTGNGELVMIPGKYISKL